MTTDEKTTADPAEGTTAAPAEDDAPTPLEAEAPDASVAAAATDEASGEAPDDLSAEAPEADADADGDAGGEEDGAGTGADSEADGEEGPEAGYDGKIEVGADVFVNVTRITPYGAFVTLTDGRTGLIHISEIDRNYVKDIREHVREGDRVEARITAIKEDGKIDLSIKAMQDPQPRMQKGRDPEFESMLKKFLRSSDERQVDFKRSQMHKRR